MTDAPVRRVLLLGFMASGKSTVGPLLARRLGWGMIDFDREIEAEEGRSVAEIFRAEGEPYFRRLEAEMTRRWGSAERVVLAPGGGWVTNPALLASLPPDTLSVWLRASAGAVLRRLRAEPGPERPLLAGPDPEAAVHRLLAEREPLYRRATLTIETDDRDAESIAHELESIVRSRVPAPLPS